MEAVATKPDLPADAVDQEQPFELTESHFFAVETKLFAQGWPRDIDFYTRQGEKFLLFRPAHQPANAREDALAVQRGGALYVLKTDRAKYLRFLEGSMLVTMTDEAIPLENRAAAMRDLSTAVIADLLADPSSRQQLTRSRAVVRGLAEFAARSPQVVQEFFLAPRTDPYLLSHSVNSTVFAIGLSARLGITGAEDVQALGMGCLLKDAGLQSIPERVLSKPGPLTPQEWMVVKRHPLLGVQLLEKAGTVSEVVRAAVLQHHEYLDGSGYPQGLGGEQIHWAARIATAVDVFDALTSDRPHAKAMETFPALVLMRDRFRDKVDAEIFRQLVQMLKA